MFSVFYVPKLALEGLWSVLPLDAEGPRHGLEVLAQESLGRNAALEDWSQLASLEFHGLLPSPPPLLWQTPQ